MEAPPKEIFGFVKLQLQKINTAPLRFVTIKLFGLRIEKQ